MRAHLVHVCEQSSDLGAQLQRQTVVRGVAGGELGLQLRVEGGEQAHARLQLAQVGVIDELIQRRVERTQIAFVHCAQLELAG